MFEASSTNFFFTFQYCRIACFSILISDNLYFTISNALSCEQIFPERLSIICQVQAENKLNNNWICFPKQFDWIRCTTWKVFILELFWSLFYRIWTETVFSQNAGKHGCECGKTPTRIKAFKYFILKTSTKIFDWVLN